MAARFTSKLHQILQRSNQNVSGDKYLTIGYIFNHKYTPAMTWEIEFNNFAEIWAAILEKAVFGGFA